jgi:hypothetical protein
MNKSELVLYHTISARHGAWLRHLQGIAGPAAVFTTIVASSVVAASEALHEASGNAIRAFCDAFVQPHGAADAPKLDADAASTDRGLQ